MNKLPISVCVISGAEERRIGRMLSSVAGWTSEIVVVLDAGATDGTEKIALAQGAKIFREPWKGFIAQKNSVASKATFPWLLGLDADEVVSEPLRKQIEALFADGPNPSAAAYRFPRCTWYCGKWIRHGDWYPDYVTRLWRKDAAQWAGVDPHANLEVRGDIQKLSGDLLHYTTSTLNYQVTKTVQYADDFAQNCLRQNRRISALDLAVRPVWRFWRGYIFRLGFLDGWQGFSVAWMTAFYTFLRYARAREAQMPGQDQP